MTRLLTCTFLLLGAVALQAQDPKPDAPKPDAPKSDADKKPLVKLETSMGDIVLELDGEKAPISVENFLKYADDKFYDGLIFHRVIPDFMIQGGGMKTDRAQKTEGLRPPIKNEWNNGLKNVRGSISMARTPAPDSATSQFFINVSDNTAGTQRDLDTPRGGAAYAVFGRVVLGMDVVDKIKAVPTQMDPAQKKAFEDAVAAGQRTRPPESSAPVDPPVIKTARKLAADERATLEPQIKAEEARQKEAAAKAKEAEAKAKEAAEKDKLQMAKEIKELMDNLQGPDGAKAVKTESGVIHLLLKEGAGATPKITDQVEVHYTGRYPDGSVFQSSVGGPPMVHPVNEFVKGFTESLMLMKVGGKSRFVIPGKLAYGDGSPTPGGQPKGTLIFDLELLSIK